MISECREGLARLLAACDKPKAGKIYESSGNTGYTRGMYAYIYGPSADEFSLSQSFSRARGAKRNVFHSLAADANCDFRIEKFVMELAAGDANLHTKGGVCAANEKYVCEVVHLVTTSVVTDKIVALKKKI